MCQATASSTNQGRKIEVNIYWHGSSQPSRPVQNNKWPTNNKKSWKLTKARTEQILNSLKELSDERDSGLQYKSLSKFWTNEYSQLSLKALTSYRLFFSRTKTTFFTKYEILQTRYYKKTTNSETLYRSFAVEYACMAGPAQSQSTIGASRSSKYPKAFLKDILQRE